MPVLDNIKIGIDTPRWLQMSSLPAVNASGNCMCTDKRNDIFSDSSIYYLTSTNLYKVNSWYNGSIDLGSHSLPYGTANWIGFVPSFGIVGTLGSGCTTTKLVTLTATTAGTAIGSLAVNQLVRSDLRKSYKIRVIGLSTGKTEERIIISNTSGATPVLYLDTPLTFTPSINDLFEIQSGIIYMVGTTSTPDVSQTKYFGTAQGILGNAGSIGINTIGDSCGVVLDELYVPYNRKSGEGFLIGTQTYDSGAFGCLQATVMYIGNMTGQASGGDAGVLVNEYRNFQIRIVEDLSTPSAVGQRRIIASNTSGPSPVYVLGSNWTVKPSTNAKYVIENPNLIILQNSFLAGMLTYNYSSLSINNGTSTIGANTWSSVYFNATHGAKVSSGCMMFPSWSHQPITQTDGTRISRHSYIWLFRGGNTQTLDRFNISGGTSGLWTNNVDYNNPISFDTGSCGDIDTVQFLGEYAYLVAGATNSMYQFNVACPSLIPWVKLPLQTGTPEISKRVTIIPYIPTNPIEPSTTIQVEDKITMVYVQSHLSNNLYRSDIIG